MCKEDTLAGGFTCEHALALFLCTVKRYAPDSGFGEFLYLLLSFRSAVPMGRNKASLFSECFLEILPCINYGCFTFPELQCPVEQVLLDVGEQLFYFSLMPSRE